MRLNNRGVSPSLPEMVKTMVDADIADLNISMPAKIVNYNKDTQFADVQPMLKAKSDSTEEVYELPVIPNVPVKHPRANGGKIFIHLPLKPGDDVQLVFSHRSLDNWKTSGGLSDPADRRMCHLTDAVAYIGGSAEPDAFSPTTDDCIEIVNDQSSAIIHPDGKWELKGGEGDDLVKLIRTFVRAIQRSYVMTLIGPQQIIDPVDPDWSELLSRCDQFTNGSDPLPPGSP